LLLLMAASSALAQQRSRALQLDAGRLLPGMDSFAVYVIRGTDTLRTGTIWDQIEIVNEAGRSRLHRVYQSQDRVLGERLDTLVDAFPDLAPVRQRSRSANGHEFVDYAPGNARGWMRDADGDSVPIRETVPRVVYGSSTFDLILRSAPLVDGWHAVVPAFIASARTVLPLRARVSGAEKIGADTCWRVEADFGGTPVTFWIHQRTRALCQQVMPLQPGTEVLFRTLPEPGSRSLAR
jgi:hypothetical protein